MKGMEHETWNSEPLQQGSVYNLGDGQEPEQRTLLYLPNGDPVQEPPEPPKRIGFRPSGRRPGVRHG